MRLAKQRALVTGAGSGIGRAVVQAFVQEGADVIAADIVFPDSYQVTGVAETVLLDVSRESDWERVCTPLYPLDIVVGCAGISAATALVQTTLQDWREVMAVNLDGAFLTIKYGARAALDKGGAIVLIGSASGTKAASGAAAYCASKGGLLMLVKSAALELKDYAIRVNCVSPAGVMTPMWKKMPFWSQLVKQYGGEDGAWKALGGADPSTPTLQRMAFPKEIADAVVFLSCPDSAHITGANLVIDGGYTL